MKDSGDERNPLATAPLRNDFPNEVNVNENVSLNPLQTIASMLKNAEDTEIMISQQNREIELLKSTLAASNRIVNTSSDSNERILDSNGENEFLRGQLLAMQQQYQQLILASQQQHQQLQQQNENQQHQIAKLMENIEVLTNEIREMRNRTLSDGGKQCSTSLRDNSKKMKRFHHDANRKSLVCFDLTNERGDESVSLFDADKMQIDGENKTSNASDFVTIQDVDETLDINPISPMNATCPASISQHLFVIDAATSTSSSTPSTSTSRNVDLNEGIANSSSTIGVNANDGACSSGAAITDGRSAVTDGRSAISAPNSTFLRSSTYADIARINASNATTVVPLPDTKEKGVKGPFPNVSTTKIRVTPIQLGKMSGDSYQRIIGELNQIHSNLIFRWHQLRSNDLPRIFTDDVAT